MTSDHPVLADGDGPTSGAEPVDQADQADQADALVDALEEHLLGSAPHLTQAQVAEAAGVPVEMARQLWHLLGFAHVPDDEAAFTDADVRALRLTRDLVGLGILSEDRQEGLVRTWGRSFARLAEWQAALLADVAVESGVDPSQAMLAISGEVTPRVEELQTYVWRRHLLSAGSRLVGSAGTSGTGSTGGGRAASTLAVCFVDIVGYTSRSRELTDRELVAWLEDFESVVLTMSVDRGARIIKNIGDELLLVADSADAMAAIALELTRRGADPDDPFPAVRAGIAHGEVVTRLGDVFGPTVNIAARLTSIARPNTVLVDLGAHDALVGDDEPASPYRFRRLRRVSVKGYSSLKVWALQRL